MAKAITQMNKQRPDPVEEQRQAVQQLLEMTGASRDALMELMSIIQEMHDAGFLDIINGFMKKREKVSVIAIQQINQPAVYQMIRNLFSVVSLLGELNPKHTNQMFQGVKVGVEKAGHSLENSEQTSVLDLMKALKDPDINRAITMMMNFLQGLGSQLESEKATKS